MSFQRRTFLRLTVATGAAVVGAPLLGAGPATAAPVGDHTAAHTRAPAGASAPGAHVGAGAQAPTQSFAIGVREFNWSRGGRQLFTKIFYPTAGTPGEPVPDAPIADGAFPVAEWSHGMGCNSDCYASQTHALASAGFICPAPSFSDNTNIGSVYNGNWSMDVSEVITQTLALNDASDDPFAGHIDAAAGVGVSGHSMGGMTTHGLVSAWPDDRIAAAVPVACVDVGDPGGLAANVLFIHGDQDPTCDYASARQAYAELSAPKAFLTHLGGDHGGYLEPTNPTFSQTQNTMLDWFRWSLYGDTAARDRLPEDASSDGTTWESELT